MSEVHIRINKRAIERALFLVVIIVLAVLLFMRWDAPVMEASQVASLEDTNTQLVRELADARIEIFNRELAAVQANMREEQTTDRLDTLQNQISNLESELQQRTQDQNVENHVSSEVRKLETLIAELREDIANMDTSAPQPTPEPEPEETLSGDLEITWDVRMSADRFEQVTVVFDNGRDRAEDLNYRLYWESLSPEFINHEGALYIASGGRQTRVIGSGDGSIPSNPGPGVTTIVLRVTDSAGNTVAELRERVR